METILERQRYAHENIERLEQGITDRILTKPRTVRDRLQLDHEIAEMLETMEMTSHSLRALYADEDGARVREVAKLSAAADGLDTFYSQLAAVKDYHRRYPDSVVEDLAAQYTTHLPDATQPFYPDEDRIARMFSGEETYGRHFDLIALHSEFINLKRNRTILYARYLEIFDTFDASAFPQYVKDDPHYVQYLGRLLEYLQSFHRRTLPLENHAATVNTYSSEFDKEWSAKASSATNGASEGEAKQDGIWCGICKKMYSKQTVYDGHLNSKKHKTGLAASETSNGARSTALSSSSSSSSSPADAKRNMAHLEFMIRKYGEKFSTIKAATRANVVRKQTLTDREWQAEQQDPGLLLLPTTRRADDQRVDAENDDDEDDKDDDEEDEADAKRANPLDLPLGWDGKPIPFWLYRLHGLGNEFPCEICGNYIYKGRKAFDRHFTEARHLSGLTCLGISAAGTPLYNAVTQIHDALALHEKAQLEARQADRRRDENTEMEDESGNVMSEKVYKDLVAQGIL